MAEEQTVTFEPAPADAGEVSQTPERRMEFLLDFIDRKRGFINAQISELKDVVKEISSNPNAQLKKEYYAGWEGHKNYDYTLIK